MSRSVVIATVAATALLIWLALRFTAPDTEHDDLAQLAPSAPPSPSEADLPLAAAPEQAALPPVDPPPVEPLSAATTVGQSLRLPVLALTRDGEPLEHIVQDDWPEAPPLGAYASSRPIPQRIRSEWLGGPRGVGRFERQEEDAAAKSGQIGWLTITASLPVQVALRLGDNVLARQEVGPATREIRFLLPRDTARGLTGSVRGRILSASADRGPVAAALVELEPTGYFAPFGDKHLAGLGGWFEIEHVPFGTAFLRVGAPGFERIVTRLEVPRGAALDVGDIELGEGRVLRGRVTYPDGSPASGVRLGIRSATASRRLMDSPLDISADQTVDDGLFALGPLGRRPYRLVAGRFDWPAEERSHRAHVLVDGEQSELTVVLQPSVRVSIRGVEIVGDGSVMSITDAGGFVVWSAGRDEWEDGRLIEGVGPHLLAGRHTLALIRSGREVWRREFDVGIEPLTIDLNR